MNLVILGAPGAGKGTQAFYLARHYGIAHISTGNMFRACVRDGLPLGKEIEDLLRRGQLVPDSITVDMVTERVKAPDAAKGFVMDGFPRTTEQAGTWERSGRPIDLVLDLHVSDDLIVERVSGRVFCPNCGATFHKTYRRPKEKGLCDICGGELLQRDDDKDQTVIERLRLYHELTDPIKDFYRTLHKAFLTIDGVGESALITGRIVQALVDHDMTYSPAEG